MDWRGILQGDSLGLVIAKRQAPGKIMKGHGQSSRMTEIIMTLKRKLWLTGKWLHGTIARHIPHIVFRQDEIEARVSFDLDKIQLDKLLQVERLLAENGIYFDRGCGCGYLDWFVDYSKSGPMHITFVRKRKIREKESCRYTLADIWLKDHSRLK